MEIFVRKNALPSQDKQAILEAVRKLYPQVMDIEIHACFFLWLDEQMEELNKRYCQSLLCAEYMEAKHFWRSSQDVLITARDGTKTQQSYVLQNIARKCKLFEINKVMAGLQYRFTLQDNEALNDSMKIDIMRHMHDQSSHRVLTNLSALAGVFSHMNEPHEAMPIGLKDLGEESLKSMSSQLDLGLSDKTVKRLYNLYTNKFKRDPYDLEVISFFDALSIHDRVEYLGSSKTSFLKDIKHTNADDKQIISAFKVHSAIYNRALRKNYYRCLDTGMYKSRMMQKYSTSFIRQYQNLDACPFECGSSAMSYAIAQSSSVGSGSKPRAHTLTLAVADITQQESKQQQRVVASARQTLLDANIGIAQFANATGVPLAAACFQTVGYSHHQGYQAGLDKPIIINKVLGDVFEKNCKDKSIEPGDEIVLLGCPVMNVGDVATKLAGGAVCPSFDHMHHAGIDLLSINQVDMQNRALNVINACCELDDNPLSVVEALGEGGLTRALLYILESDKEESYGFHIQLRNINTIRNNFTAMQIWGSEMQERYLVVCSPGKMEKLLHFADREQCPYATIGRVIHEPKLEIYDEYFEKYYMDINHSHLTATANEVETSAKHEPIRFSAPDHDIDNAQKALMLLLMSSSLCSKNFLLKNHDTYNGGMVVSGPYIGRTQVPIGNYGLLRQGFVDYAGELLVVTERLAMSYIDPIAASKHAIADALIRAAAVDFDTNSLAYEFQWVCEKKCPGATQDLQNVIKKVYADIQHKLPGNITETKISTKHSTLSAAQDIDKTSIIPPSCIVNLTAELKDAQRYKTGMIDTDHNNADIVWINLNNSKQATLAGSMLNQEHGKYGESYTNIDLSIITKWIEVSKQINQKAGMYSYQPVGQGGLAFTCAQLVMAGELGVELNLNAKQYQDKKALFSEAPGVVLVVAKDTTADIRALLEQHGLGKHMHIIGKTIKNRALIASIGSEEVINISERLLHEGWEYQGRSLLNEHGKYEHNVLRLNNAKILYDNFGLNQQQWLAAGEKPKVGMLVEPGAIGAHNLAAALSTVGFIVVEFSLADIINHHENLQAFAGLVIPNGQTYQAVGKPGRIAAMQVLREPKLKAMFSEFFQSPYSFTIAVGDGSHILSELRSIIPGTEKWPHIIDNENKKVENRWVMAKITENTKSIVLQGMQGSTLPLCIAHKHGQIYHRDPTLLKHDERAQQQLIAHYVNEQGEVAEKYPYNPNGSVMASCGFCSEDGKVTAIIGLPERGIHPTQLPFNDPSCHKNGPWLRLFANARQWVEDNPQPPIRF